MATIKLTNDDVNTILDALNEAAEQDEDAGELELKIRKAAIDGLPATLTFGEDEE